MTDVGSLFPSDMPTTVRSALQRHEGEPGALLPILHDVQDALGYIPPDAVPIIAKGLNLSRAEVHGVIKYYHHFRSEPRDALSCRCAAPSRARRGRRRADGARRKSARLRVSPHACRRRIHAGAGVLPRDVRVVAGDHGG